MSLLNICDSSRFYLIYLQMFICRNEINSLYNFRTYALLRNNSQRIRFFNHLQVLRKALRSSLRFC